MGEVSFDRLNGNNKQLVNEAIKQELGECKDLYHGTSSKNAKEILATKNFKIPSKPSGWLGRGIYCYLHDAEACRIYAREHHKTESIAVISLTANLDNTFFVFKELYHFFRNLAEKHKEIKLVIDERIGFIIESFLKQVIMPDYNINISTVGRSYNLNDNRAVTMYSLRNKQMIKSQSLRLYSEEK